MCYNIASVFCFGFLAVRHVGSYLPNQGLNTPPPLEGKVSTTALPGKSLAQEF